MTEIQSIIFKKDFFSKSDALQWLKTHNFKTTFRNKMIDEKRDTYRARQHDPSRYKSFVTKKINQDISIVLGIK
jgi:hypothetical protein